MTLRGARLGGRLRITTSAQQETDAEIQPKSTLAIEGNDGIAPSAPRPGIMSAEPNYREGMTEAERKQETRGSHLALYDDQATYFEGLIKFIRKVDAGERK